MYSQNYIDYFTFPLLSMVSMLGYFLWIIYYFFFLVNEFFHLHVIHVYRRLLFLIPVYVFYWNVSRLVAVESDILQNVLARLKYCEEEEKVLLLLLKIKLHINYNMFML